MAVFLFLVYCGIAAWSWYMFWLGHYLCAAGLLYIVVCGRDIFAHFGRKLWVQTDRPLGLEPLGLDELCEELGGRPESTVRIDGEGKIIG